MRTEKIIHVGYGKHEPRLVEDDPAKLIGGVTILDIINELDDSYELIPVDRNDDLKNSMDTVQECIEQGTLDPLYDLTADWWYDVEWESVTHIECELKQEVKRLYRYEIDLGPFWPSDSLLQDEDDHIEDGVENIFEDYDDWIRDAIWDRNKSTPLSDLISNTGDIILHYQTDCEHIDSNFSTDYADSVWEIKKFLGIKKKDKRWDNDLAQMVMQAGYGGSLTFYFHGSIIDWAKDYGPRINAIKFKDPHIAIWDNINGSGDNCQLKGFEITMPFRRHWLGVDSESHYNYTYDICGMSEDWCQDTEVTLTHKRYRRPTNATKVP